jgi:hypothetical protein
VYFRFPEHLKRKQEPVGLCLLRTVRSLPCTYWYHTVTDTVWYRQIIWTRYSPAPYEMIRALLYLYTHKFISKKLLESIAKGYVNYCTGLRPLSLISGLAQADKRSAWCAIAKMEISQQTHPDGAQENNLLLFYLLESYWNRL